MRCGIQTPLVRGIDGGRRREDANRRAARWFRFLASAMRLGADDLEDTPHYEPLVRQATRLDGYADDLEEARLAAPALSLVRGASSG